MYKNQKISVLIPCRNEEATIGSVLRELPNFVDEIIVVDNNSTDRTPEVIKKQRNVLLAHESLRGYGAAIKRGIKKSRGDIVSVIDGDGQHSFKDLTSLIDYLMKENLDFVWGSRFPITNQDEMSPERIFGNKIQTILFNFLFGTRIKDSQSGMMVFCRGKLFKNINLDLLHNGMAFSEEIKLRAIFAGLKYGEQKITIKKRSGASKLNPLVDGIKNISKILKLFYEFKIKKNR